MQEPTAVQARRGTGPSDDRLSFLLFLAGCALLVFLAGMVAGRFRLPPYALLDAAKDAAVAAKDRYLLPDEPFAFDTQETRAGVVAWDRERAMPGLTLFTGYHDGRFGARLVDMAGRVVHRWDAAFSAVWPEAAPHVQAQAPDRLVTWHGVHLFPDGDLLFNFQGGNFPLGGGLVRLDQDSRVEWRLARNTHHDLAVGADGTIVAPAHVYRPEGVAACGGLIDPPYYEDLLLTVSPDGQVRDEVSVLSALCRSPYKGLLSIIGTESGTWRGRLSADDPLHLNSVDIVTPELAAALPMARPGQLLLSLRNLNAVGFFEPQSGAFTWMLAGPFVRQHDPDLLADGRMLIFDNRGAMDGRSQVLELDPTTQAVTWRFEGSTADPFWSQKMGNQQKLPNGNVLITESWSGRLLEVTAGMPPEVVWQYVNLLPATGEGDRIGLVSEARRFGADELTFLPRGGSG